MRINETEKLLQRMFEAGHVEKRVSSEGLVEWRITDKGRTISRVELERLESTW